MSEDLILPLLLVGLLLAAFMAFAVLAVRTANRGWRQLCEVYAAGDLYHGPTWQGQTVGIGNTRYRNRVTTGADAIGLYLEVPVVFRKATRALYFPWDRLSAEFRSWGVYLKPEGVEPGLFLPSALYDEMTAEIPEAPKEKAA